MEEVKRITEEITGLNDNYANSVKNAEESTAKLEETENRLGISSEDLYEKVKQGTLDYKDMDAAQREVWEAYTNNIEAQDKLSGTMSDYEVIQKNAKDATDRLTQAQKDQKTAKQNLKKATDDLTEAERESNVAFLETQMALAEKRGDFDKTGKSSRDFADKVIKAFEDGKISAQDAQEIISKAMAGMSDNTRKAFVEEMPASIKDGLDPAGYENTGNKITNWFKNTAEKAKEWWYKTFKINSPSKVMIEIGENIGDGLKNGMENRKNTINSTVSGILSSMQTTLSGGISKMQEIGSNLMNAIGTGLENAKNLVVNTAKNIGNSITTGVQNIFGIHSPSTVFAEIGENLGKGLIRGIKSTENAINNTMDNIFSSLDGNATLNIDSIISNPEISKMTQGAILRQPTISSVSDYVKSAGTFDIEAPQNIMYETMLEANTESNGVLAVAISDFANRIVETIKENRPVAYFGDQDVFASSERGRTQYNRMVGVPNR